MTQLCNNVMGYLNTKGLYPTLQVFAVGCKITWLSCKQRFCPYLTVCSDMLNYILFTCHRYCCLRVLPDPNQVSNLLLSQPYWHWLCGKECNVKWMNLVNYRKRRTYLLDMYVLHFRPLLAADFSDNLLTLFVLNILSVPAVIYHLNLMAQEVSSIVL